MVRKAIVFDLDGTIWRGHEWYAQMLKDYCEGKISWVMQRLSIGESVISIAESLGLSRSQFLDICRNRVSELELYEGVIQTLQILSAKDFSLSIVTNLSGSIVRSGIEYHKLEKYFGAVIHAGNCRARKPSPLPILLAINKSGGDDATEKFFIGDSPSDMEAAIRAKLEFVWSSYGYYGASAFHDKPSILIKNFTEASYL